MSKEINRRLQNLEELAKETSDKGGVWMVWLNGSNLRITNAGLAKTVMHYTAASPAEAVKAVEDCIIRKAPGHVNFSYHIDDLFELYPEYLDAYAQYAPMPVSNMTTGDYCGSLASLSLRHIILYNHLHMWAQETGATRQTGAYLTKEGFERVQQGGEPAIFAALADVIEKERHFYATADPEHIDNRYLFAHPNRIKCGRAET